MNFKVGIFDMDGTLIDSLMIWDVLWEQFGVAYAGDPAFRPCDVDQKAVRTVTLKDAMQLIHENYNFAESGEALLSHANEVMLYFYTNVVQLKPGVRAFLERCREKGVQMCIASATAPDLIRTVLEYLHIDFYFSAIFSCTQLGVGKEKPDIYLMARDHFGVETGECCVFEDSVLALETAHNAGMQTVGIFDRYGFGYDRMQKIATHYIAQGHTLEELI